MCTQQLIWCACGHGEFLPIVHCTRAVRWGYCWTVVHGDHRVVVGMACSYCKLQAGLDDREEGLGRPLGFGGNKEVDGDGLKKAEVEKVLVEEEEEAVKGDGEKEGLKGEQGTRLLTPLLGCDDWVDVLGTEFGNGFDLAWDLGEGGGEGV